MDVGKRIKELREALGLTGVGLAKKAGIKQSTLYSIEAEGVQPTIPTLEAICQGLGINSGLNEDKLIQRTDSGYMVFSYLGGVERKKVVVTLTGGLADHTGREGSDSPVFEYLLDAVLFILGSVA